MTDEPVGERLLLSNDRVRVWTDMIAPGEAQPVHTHQLPYLSITLTAAKGHVLDADGAVRYEVDRDPGEATWFGPDKVPTTHTLRNTGAEEMRVIIVEILDPP